MATVKLGWGQDIFGRMKHIKDVQRGKACDCTCPECGTPLIARKGDEVQWHFAHSVPVECTAESALHKAAKQILIEAIKEGKGLQLPEDTGSVYAKDMLDIEHSLDWKLPALSASYTSGQIEFRLRQDLVTDVLLTTDNSRSSLAVEIHVTNKKTDEDQAKFQSLAQQSIEIDLSNLQWDSDFGAIHDAVLRSAPRRWLYSTESKQFISQAREDLAGLIDSNNQILLKDLDDYIAPAKRASDLGVLRLEWPILQVIKRRKNAFGVKIEGKAEASPAITSISEDWIRVSRGWKVKGVAGKKTPVDVVFIPVGAFADDLVTDRPTLVVEVGTYDWIPSIYLSWIGHHAWMKVLGKRATRDLESRLTEDNGRKNIYDKFAEQFKAATDQEKLQILSNRLELPCPKWSGKLTPAWGTTWPVWKALVWVYKLQRYKGKSVYTKSIAEDDWLKQLLSWPEDIASVDARAKDLWFWFNDLQKAGIVTHKGRQWFEVIKKLPKDFAPWQRINT